MVTHFDRDRPVTAAAHAALEWQVRLMSPDVSAQTRSDFETWRNASPENAQAYQVLVSMWDKMETVADLNFDKASRRAACLSVSFRPFGGDVQAFLKPGVIAAFCVVFLMSATTLFFVQSRNNATIETFRTAIGEYQEFSLPDGSMLSLNTGSAVEVAFEEKLRLVRLIDGQASFVVSHNSDRPFVVAAGDAAVLATGTEFDVYETDEAVKVTLLEGGVRVARGFDSDAEIEKMANGANANSERAVVILKAGEEVSVIRSTGAITPVVKTDPARARDWRRGKVTFRDTPLKEAIAEMNRYTPLDIQLDDPALGELRISGAFETDGVERFLSAVEALFDLKSERQGRSVILAQE